MGSGVRVRLSMCLYDDINDTNEENVLNILSPPTPHYRLSARAYI